MYNYYKGIAENTIEKYKLTDEEIEAIFRMKEFEYRVEDVRIHAENLMGDGLITEKEYQYIFDHDEFFAEKYIYEEQDCNLPENDVFDCMLRTFIRDLE